eukprot:4171950-Pyramimonas_sp.AAC.1
MAKDLRGGIKDVDDVREAKRAKLAELGAPPKENHARKGKVSKAEGGAPMTEKPQVASKKTVKVANDKSEI